MAGIIAATASTAFEVSFGDTGLFVRATIFNMATGSPVFSSTVNMVETPGTPGSYGATHVFPVGTWMITKRVYTDGTYTVLSNLYSPGSEAFNAIVMGPPLTSGSSGCIITAVVTQEQIAVTVLNLVTPDVLSTESSQILLQESGDEILV
jgi:hypothetical protein